MKFNIIEVAWEEGGGGRARTCQAARWVHPQHYSAPWREARPCNPSNQKTNNNINTILITTDFIVV